MFWLFVIATAGLAARGRWMKRKAA
jgi:hypothetical protein